MRVALYAFNSLFGILIGKNSFTLIEVPFNSLFGILANMREEDPYLYNLSTPFSGFRGIALRRVGLWSVKLSTPFSGFSGEWTSGSSGRGTAFNSLFGIRVKRLFPRQLLGESFQLPFRDSEHLRYFYRVHAGDSFNSLFGILRDIRLSCLVTMSCFQLPFRDSILRNCNKSIVVASFQLPFRDSKTTRRG